MNNEIKLPPLPSLPLWLVPSLGPILEEYGRASVEQDRARREKRAPLRALLALQKDGYVDVNSDDDHAQHLIVLRWTPKRVWIESEKNRELARILRKHYYNSELAFDVADDLDGGKR